MRLVAEFTTEPFRGEGETPLHARRAWEVIQAAGLTGDFGPLGTQFTGPADDVLDTLRIVLAAALAAGATRVTLQVTPEG
ncbi:MAG: thiamine-binding protein [Nakamurella sp.]